MQLPPRQPGYPSCSEVPAIATKDLLVDVYFHFYHSSKRKEESKEFLDFTETDDLKDTADGEAKVWPTVPDISLVYLDEITKRNLVPKVMKRNRLQF